MIGWAIPGWGAKVLHATWQAVSTSRYEMYSVIPVTVNVFIQICALTAWYVWAVATV